jgi:hypothetical protein
MEAHKKKKSKALKLYKALLKLCNPNNTIFLLTQSFVSLPLTLNQVVPLFAQKLFFLRNKKDAVVGKLCFLCN